MKNPLFENEPKPLFEVLLDNVRFPVVEIENPPLPEILRNRKIRRVAFLGYHAKSKNIKDLPADAMLLEAIASGRLTSGGQGIVSSSGNLAIAAHRRGQELGIRIKASISSKLSSGKLAPLKERQIELLTERDLTVFLGPEAVGKNLIQMTELYAQRTGIEHIDQYDSCFNAIGYDGAVAQTVEGLGGKISGFVSTIGTKGKFNSFGLGIKKENRRALLVAASPYVGDELPAARDGFRQKEVSNPFLAKPDFKRRLDPMVAYAEAAGLYEAGIPGGISFGAEVATIRHFLLEMLEIGRLEELRLADGWIVMLAVCSDMIFPYIDDGVRLYPHLFRRIRDLCK